MNLKRLHEILADSTVQLRKGMEVEGHDAGGVTVVDINMMAHADEAKDVPGIETVDMELLVVGVSTSVAESYKDELIEILKEYPEPERLVGGPSYIEVGAVLGDQGAAFQLFALGKVLGLWNVITPATLHMKGQQAIDMAGRGFIMMSGYKVAA